MEGVRQGCSGRGKAFPLFPSRPGIDLYSMSDWVQEGDFALASVVRLGESCRRDTEG